VPVLLIGDSCLSNNSVHEDMGTKKKKKKEILENIHETSLAASINHKKTLLLLESTSSG